MYQNNLKALLCLSVDGCAVTQVLPYDCLHDKPLLACPSQKTLRNDTIRERFKYLYEVSGIYNWLKEIYNQRLKPAKEDGFEFGDMFVFSGDVLHAGPSTKNDPRDRLFLFMTLDFGHTADYHNRQLHPASLYEVLHGCNSPQKLRAVAIHCAARRASDAEVKNACDCSWPKNSTRGGGDVGRNDDGRPEYPFVK